MRGERERVPGNVTTGEARFHPAQILTVKPLERQLGKVSRHHPTESIAILTHPPGLRRSHRQQPPAGVVQHFGFGLGKPNVHMTLGSYD